MRAIHLIAAAILFAAMMAIALVRRDGHHPHSRFGAANWVTTLRACLVSLVASFIVDPTPPDAAIWVSLVATAAAALDGLDGRLARALGLVSPFGARFDMEVDALLILVLAWLAWQFDRAGVWVLLSGLLRYVFVAGSWLWPWLDGPLAPSTRRKVVCVLQIAGLIVAIAPVVPAPLAVTAAAGSLLLLVWSFAVDVWSLRAAHVTQTP